MRKKVKIILFMVALVLGFSVKINYLLIDQGIIVKERKVQSENIINYPKMSGYWDLPFIHIDGNWSYTAFLYDWCSGDGSWSTPYTIENVAINASNSPTGSGILINNSKQIYFCIINCTVFNSGTGDWDAGIKLENSNKGTITKNNCSNNGHRGIFLLRNCDNITVVENIIYENNDGILVIDSHNIKIVENAIYRNQDGLGVGSNITVSRNKIYENYRYGIVIRDGNTISDNTINNNGDGIFGYDCEYNAISGNKIYNNDRNGIYLWNQFCEYNTISGNIIFNNSETGILLEELCWDNIIVGNLVYENDDYGIWLSNGDGGPCDDNLVYNNFISNNSRDNARDDSGSNYWNGPYVGNYWSDYTGIDADGDGIGDTPYSRIDGMGDDYRPIMIYSGFISAKPDDLTYEIATTGHYLNWTVTHPSPISYTVLRNGTSVKSGVLISQIANIGILVDGLLEGDYLFKLEVEQTVIGVPNSDNATVRVTNANPMFTQKPGNRSYEQGQTGNILSWTFSDVSTNNPGYSIFRDGILVIVDNPCVPGVPIELNVDGLYVGVYVFTIIVEDGYGKTSQDIVWVGVTSSLTIEFIDQLFSTEEFNITYLVRNQNYQGIDFLTMQAWWNGTDVSTSVQNLGDGIYFISLDPITVAPGEDAILLKIVVSASGYAEKNFETYIAVDPETLTKSEDTTPDELPIIVIAITTGSTIGTLAIVGVIIALLRRRK